MARIYPTGEEVTIGQRRFEVEWQEVKPSARDKDEIDHDVDIVFRCRFYLDKATAKRAARMVVNSRRTAYGSATVTEQVAEWIDDRYYVAEWSNVGEPEYVD